MSLTPEQIEADKKLCEAATPGPWCVRDRDANIGLAGCDLHHEIGHFIAHFRAGARVTKIEQHNCRFTARARTALPDYIAALAEKDARIAKLEAVEAAVQRFLACEIVSANDPHIDFHAARRDLDAALARAAMKDGGK